MRKFKQVLKLLMEERAISLSQLANETGIAKSTLHSYLYDGEPKLSQVIKLANYFELSLDEMVNGSTESNTNQSKNAIFLLDEPITAQIKEKTYQISIVEVKNEIL